MKKLYESIERLVETPRDQQTLEEGTITDVVDFFRNSKNDIMKWYNKLRRGDNSYRARLLRRLEQEVEANGEKVPKSESGLYARFRASVLKPLSDKLVSLIITVFRPNNPEDPVSLTTELFLIGAGLVAAASGLWKIALFFLIMKTYSNATHRKNRQESVESPGHITESISEIVNEDPFD